MKKAEIRAALGAINRQIRKANECHEWALSMDRRIDTAEESGDDERAARLERRQNRLFEDSKTAYNDARAMMALLSCMGYHAMPEEYQTGKYYPEIEDIVPESAYENMFY